jgi:hypothetical protein
MYIKLYVYQTLCTSKYNARAKLVIAVDSYIHYGIKLNSENLPVSDNSLNGTIGYKSG